MFCNKCGAQIPYGTDVCGNCGNQISENLPNTVQQFNYNQQYGYPLPQKQNSGLAIASMVLGILSILFFWIPILPALLAILAIILAGVALKKKIKGGNKGMAIAGLVCGIIGLLLGINQIITYYLVLNTINYISSLPDVKYFR